MSPQQILGGKVLVAVAKWKVGEERGATTRKLSLVTKTQVAHCVIVDTYTLTIPFDAQLQALLHVALVHEALATDLPAASRLGTVHDLLVSVELHDVVIHLTTKCTIGLQ